MIAAGLVLASFGGLYQLYASNLLLIGLLGASGMFSPMMADVTRWFDRHRGSAIALVSSGQYVAGAVWPLPFQAGVDAFDWRLTMRVFAIVVAATILPLAAWFFLPPPAPGGAGSIATGCRTDAPLRQLHPTLTMALLAVAIFCCCVTMSMPLAHIVAYCGDIGLGAKPGAAMLSLQLAAGVIAQQLWGWVADRVGGLRTVLFTPTGMADLVTGLRSACFPRDIHRREARHAVTCESTVLPRRISEEPFDNVLIKVCATLPLMLPVIRMFSVS
jgi:nitrate/nitrite transporter NarK